MKLVFSFAKDGLLSSALLGICLAIVTATSVSAAIVDPIFSGHAQASVAGAPVGGSQDFTGPTLDLSASNSFGSADAHIVADLSDPSLRTYGSTSSNAAVSVGVAGLTYQLMVIGPGNGPVDVNVSASGSIITSGQVLSLTDILLIGKGPANISASDIVNERLAGNWSVNGTYSFQANQIYTVTMDVAAVAEMGAASYDVSVDPHFTIAPDFKDYSLVFSQGIDNISPVPEPSTWTMMMLGFLGVGFLTCRRKNHTTFSAA